MRKDCDGRKCLVKDRTGNWQNYRAGGWKKSGPENGKKITRLDGGIREITKTCKMRGRKFDKTLTESDIDL